MKNKIATILMFLMCLGAVYFTFVTNIYYLLLFLSSFLFTWFGYKVVDALKVNQKYKIVVAIAVWLHLLGELYLYGNLLYYDKVLHFVVPFFIASIVYDYIKKYKLEYPKTTILFLVLGMLASFEIFEYFMDVAFDIGMLGVYSTRRGLVMNELNDTMWDMLAGVLGVLILLILRKDGK